VMHPSDRPTARMDLSPSVDENESDVTCPEKG
jgi:hypothetical protein